MPPRPYTVLATDYDGTLAHHGTTAASTCDALARLRDAGGVPVLVTGREVPDLQRVFDRMDLFDIIVAENGALLYWPDTGREELLGPPPEEAFVAALRQRGVAPLSVGRVVVATFEPHEVAVLELIRDLGLERQVIFNKGAVMVLPSGINKATGLEAALALIGHASNAVAGVGDAENDHALLQFCGLGAAVGNAIPSLKAHADVVLERSHGAGVEELIDRMLDGSLASVRRRDRGLSQVAAGSAPRESHGSPLD